MATITNLRLGPADHGRRLSLQEFWEAEETEGYRYELARGVLEVTHVPGDAHGLIVCFLYKLFARYDQDHPHVIERFGGASEFRLWLPTMVSGRYPDAAVVIRNTPKDEQGVRPPVLVVEVVSEGSEARERDYVTKREEYLAYGLREYWIIDPFARRVTVLIRAGDAWRERVFVDGQLAEGLALPGLTLAVSDVWAATDPDAETSER
jgi:Uma2 family endonuclease